MNYQFKKRIQKTMRQEARQMREEKRQKSGFYSRLITGLLILLLIGFSFVTWQINDLYDDLISQTQNISKSEIRGNFEPLEASVEPTLARITCYTWTGNKMANGLYPEYGYVATSDRSIELGTEIIIDGETFIVGDRTALWVDEKFGLTVDIFMESGCDISFGADKKLILIK